MKSTAPHTPISTFGESLYRALRDRSPIPPLTTSRAALTTEDAYAISLDFLNRREQDGERVIGKKIGVTSKAVQEMLGVFQPDFGFLTDRMQVPDGSTVDIQETGLLQPRAEAEIAFVLKEDLVGPGISERDVLRATEYIVPCFEIVDSRIEDWNISIVDTIADNASCGIFALGKDFVDPNDFDLPNLEVTVSKNGSFLSRGLGSAVQGSPLTAVAWLANTLGQYDVPLKAREIILSGSVVPLEPAKPGDTFDMLLKNVGGCSISFK